MRRGKWMVCLAAALAALLLLAAHALAESVADYDKPTNPYFEAAQLPKTPPPGASTRLRARAGVTVLARQTGECFTEDTTWTIYVESTDGSSADYRYRYYLLNVEPDGSYNPNGFQETSDSNTFTYRFVVPGTYQLWVYIYDSEGAPVTSAAFSVRDTNVSDRPTLEEKVSEIVQDCRAAGVEGEYETALWLHDWIINHAHYDYDLRYYSADAVLVRGTGVCDSYSKAYVKLLREAGIACGRVTGGNHAWNVARLEGKWYQIDPTWNDPGSSKVPVSGSERHIYFGLTDAIMKLDHTYERYEGVDAVDCAALDCNFFIRTGTGLAGVWADSLNGAVLSGLDGGSYVYSIDTPEYYASERGAGIYTTGSGQVVYNLAAYVLNQRDAWSYGGQTLRLRFGAYDMSSRRLPVELRFDGVTLDLPAALTTVDAQAFQGGAAFQAVELPEGATSIGARAFAECAGLWKVAIPDSVTQIDATAFEGCHHVSIACAADSYAESFARANNLNCVIE